MNTIPLYPGTIAYLPKVDGSFIVMAQFHAPKALKSWLRLRSPDDMDVEDAGAFSMLLIRDWGESDMGDISLNEYLEGHGFTVLKELH